MVIASFGKLIRYERRTHQQLIDARASEKSKKRTARSYRGLNLTLFSVSGGICAAQSVIYSR